MSSIQQKIVMAAVAAGASIALNGCDDTDGGNTNGIKCNPWKVDDADIQNTCATVQPAIQPAAANGTNGTNATNATSATNVTDTDWVCAPGASGGSTAEMTDLELFFNQTKALYSQNSNVTDLKADSTGFLNEDVNVMNEQTNANDSADAVFQFFLNNNFTAVMDTYPSLLGNASEWKRLVDVTVAGKIANHSQIQDDPNLTVSWNPAGVSGATGWETEGLCYDTSLDNATDCYVYEDCRTDEEKEALQWLLSSNSSDVSTVPKNMIQQARYCSFLPGQKVGKCIEKEPLYSIPVAYPGAKSNGNITGIKCRGVNSVSFGHYCDTRKNPTDEPNGEGDGVLVPLEDFTANNPQWLGSVVQNRETCVTGFDCSRSKSDSENNLCLNATVLMGEDIASSTWYHYYGLCGSQAEADTSSAQVRSDIPYQGYPFVKHATQRANITSTVGYHPCTAEPIEENIGSSNDTDYYKFFGFTAPPVLSMLMNCTQHITEIVDTNLNKYQIHSSNAAVSSQSNFTPILELTADQFAPLYEEWGLLLKAGEFEYAQECKKSLDCGAGYYCKRKFYPAHAVTAYSELATAVQQARGNDGTYLSAKLLAMAISGDDSSLANGGALVCESVPEVTYDDVHAFIAGDTTVPCTVTGTSAMNVDSSTCTDNRFVDARDANLTAFFQGKVDVDVHGNVVSGHCAAAGLSVSQSNLTTVSIDAKWQDWQPMGLIMQKVTSGSLTQKAGFCGPNGIFITESVDKPADDDVDCVPVNAKLLALQGPEWADIQEFQNTWAGYTPQQRKVQLYSKDATGVYVPQEGSSKTIYGCAPQLLKVTSNAGTPQFITSIEAAAAASASNQISPTDVAALGAYFGEATEEEINTVLNNSPGPVFKKVGGTGWANDAATIPRTPFPRLFGKALGNGKSADDLTSNKAPTKNVECIVDADCRVWTATSIPGQFLSPRETFVQYATNSSYYESTDQLKLCFEGQCKGPTPNPSACDALNCADFEYCGMVAPNTNLDGADASYEARCVTNVMADSNVTNHTMAWVESIIECGPMDDNWNNGTCSAPVAPNATTNSTQ